MHWRIGLRRVYIEYRGERYAFNQLGNFESTGFVADVFGEVIVPRAVHREVVLNGKGKAGYEALSETNWFHIVEVQNLELKDSIMIELDEGESEVICAAKDKNIRLVCIDEFAGRQYAKLLQLDVVGTLGILLAAKKRGYIGELSPLITKLIENHRYVSEKVRNEVLRKSGEKEQ